MSDLRLQVPEGYFEDSLKKTMENISRQQRRRRSIAGLCAVLVFILAGGLAVWTGVHFRNEKEYYALEAEIAQLDIFLEINQ